MINFIYGIMLGFSFFVILLEIYGYRQRIRKLETEINCLKKECEKLWSSHIVLEMELQHHINKRSMNSAITLCKEDNSTDISK